MSHLMTCPECNKHLQVPDDLIGQQVQCPECRHTFIATLPHEPGPSHSKPARGADESDSWERHSTRAGSSRKKNSRGYDDGDDDDDVRRRHDEDDDDNLNVRRDAGALRRGGGIKPGHVTGIGVMALVGGIWAVLWALGYFVAFGIGSMGVCCMWPGIYYSLVAGILAIVKGSSILGSHAYMNRPPTGIAVVMIINIINGDLLNLVLGILILVFCGDEEVKGYFAP
jgi:hypothetical protein